MKSALAIFGLFISLNASALTRNDIGYLCQDDDHRIAKAIGAAWGVPFVFSSPQEIDDAKKLFVDPGFQVEVQKDLAVKNYNLPYAIAYIRGICAQ